MDEEGSGGEDEERSMEGPINKLDGERYLQLQILSFGKQVQGVNFQVTAYVQVLTFALDGYCELKLVKINRH